MLPKKKNLEEERAKHTVDSLYKDYVDDLFSYALGFGFDKQTAMDAIHDVFCRVCIREREVQEIQNPKFYLLRALRNQLIDTYKLKRNYSEVLTGEITDELPYKIKITVEDEIIAAEEQAEVSQKVDEILSILTERQREIIYLRYMQECSYEEIAEIMQISVPACRKLLYRTLLPLFLIFILYMIKVLEIGMDWDFTSLGVYPLSKKGMFGIFTHPLIHSGFKHLLTNTLPLFFLSWCLFYFYRSIAPSIFLIIWIGCGAITFLIGKPTWHIGASGIIYGLAFFLFFSGLLRKYIPLIAISLLVTFLYGGLIWNMLPYFTPSGISWEGHLSGAIIGTICAFSFMGYGPQKPDPFANEQEEESVSATDETDNIEMDKEEEHEIDAE